MESNILAQYGHNSSTKRLGQFLEYTILLKFEKKVDIF